MSEYSISVLVDVVKGSLRNSYDFIHCTFSRGFLPGDVPRIGTPEIARLLGTIEPKPHNAGDVLRLHAAGKHYGRDVVSVFYISQFHGASVLVNEDSVSDTQGRVYRTIDLLIEGEQ
ncbi:hypothetical protein HYY72_04435 [Candidatus Woesearchaeota archaeon]|nr:hypothetical protein [Candidatus Woesearchaeota archaeon]